MAKKAKKAAKKAKKAEEEVRPLGNGAVSVAELPHFFSALSSHKIARVTSSMAAHRSARGRHTRAECQAAEAIAVARSPLPHNPT